MAEIKVTSAVVRNKAEELRNLNSQFKSKVEELVGIEQNLVSMWEGDAKTAFHNVFTNDKVQWTNFQTLVEQYIVTLENITIEYDNREALNTNIASNRTY